MWGGGQDQGMRQGQYGQPGYGAGQQQWGNDPAVSQWARDAPLAQPGTVGPAPLQQAPSYGSQYNSSHGSVQSAGTSAYVGQPAAGPYGAPPAGYVPPSPPLSVLSESHGQLQPSPSLSISQGSIGQHLQGGPEMLTFTPTAQAKIETWRLDNIDKVTRDQLRALNERLARVSAEHQQLYGRVQATAVPDGVIKVRVLRATGLRAMDPDGLSDPYVIVRFVPVHKGGRLRTAIGMPESFAGQAQQEHRTEVVKKSLNPMFNSNAVYEFTVEQKHFLTEAGQPVQPPNGPTLTFRVMDEDMVTDDFLGYFVMPWERLATEFSAPGSVAVLDLAKAKYKSEALGQGLLEVHINYERKVPHTAETFTDTQRLNRVTAEMRHMTALVNQKTAKMIHLCKTRYERARHDLATFSRARTDLYAEQNRLAGESASATAVNGELLVWPIRCEGTKGGFNLFGTADVYLVFRVNDGNRLTVPAYQERDDALCPVFGETPVVPMPATKAVIFDERAFANAGGAARPPYAAAVSKPTAYIVVDVFHSVSGAPRTLVPLVNRCLGRVHVAVLDVLHLPPGERSFPLEPDAVDGLFGSAATGTLTLKFEFRQRAVPSALLDPALKEFEEEERRATLDLMRRETEYVTAQMKAAEDDLRLFEQLRLQYDTAEKGNMLARGASGLAPILPLAP